MRNLFGATAQMLGYVMLTSVAIWAIVAYVP